MSETKQKRSERGRHGRILAFLPTLMVLALAGAAVAQPDDEGHFEVRSASVELTDGIYYADADIDLRLSSEASELLHTWQPLTITVEVEFLNRLRLWWDTTEFQVRRRSQLSFRPVTDRYVVYNIDTNVTEAFITLSAALDFIGRVDGLAVVDESDLDEDRRYEVRVRAVLDKDDLPGPLRLIAFWRRDWSIASEWLQWRLEDE